MNPRELDGSGGLEGSVDVDALVVELIVRRQLIATGCLEELKMKSYKSLQLKPHLRKLTG
jgi:hypothetical protein